MYHPRGVYGAMPTPFKRNGDLDGGLLSELVAHFEDTGINGLLVMGTAGEFALMNEAERRAVVDIAVDAAKKIELIINAGSASTRETIQLAKYIKDAGADAVVAVEPYFFHPTQEGIARHYLTIASAIDFPVIAYNIPSFAGNRMAPDILEEFARDDRIVGLKDSEGDAAKLSEFIFRSPKNFSVLVGMDSLVSSGLAIGAEGMAIGSACIAPRICAEMYRAMTNKKYDKAFELQKSLDHAIRAMQVGTFPAAIKYALTLQGFPAGHVRAPLQELTDAERIVVEDHLRNAGINEELFA
ncbi:4-hydroxy-tetrahydrodipicolinate synthase [Methanocella sp. MCL-LM]|uniref:4-hydroxy-tetrahydrodipicolinate synthase n=1 Tax=Methanocella sp. MCL-LM TaxID=3412035 RepID=UPI003C70DD24